MQFARPTSAAQPLARNLAAWPRLRGGPGGPLAWVGLGALAVVLLPLGAFLALALGAALGQLCGRPAGAEWLGKRLLEACIIGLGFTLNGAAVLAAGGAGLAATAVTLGLALALGRALSRRLGIERETGLLITFGTAICGGSAIAAAAPALRARPEQVGAALAVVFTLNGAALLLFPALGHGLGLTAEQFGMWCAIAIHDTSSVVGAAAAFGPEALELATTTKLARALWIVPVVALLARPRERADEGARVRARPPGFLLGFLAAVAVTTFMPASAPFTEWLGPAARRGLPLALFFTGLGVRADGLRARPALLGIGLWAVLAGASLAWILARSGA